MSYAQVNIGEVKVKHSKEISIKYEQVEGYYFIYKDEKGSKVARWMAVDKYGAAKVLESFADKYLKASNWWQVDYCHGYDARGVLQWADFYYGEDVLSLSLKVFDNRLKKKLDSINQGWYNKPNKTTNMRYVIMSYLNLNVTAKIRLEILKRSAEKLNNGHNRRKAQNDPTPYNWRDVRYSRFHNAHTSKCRLSSGMNGETKIWYCHTGQYFGRENFADQVLGLRHEGYFENDLGDIVRGIVVSLSGGRFLAGYCMTSNGERVYYSDIFDDENCAAVFADECADEIARECREYDERYREAVELENVIESNRHRLKELVILANAGVDYARQQMRDVARHIRQARRELATEYAGIL